MSRTPREVPGSALSDAGLWQRRMREPPLAPVIPVPRHGGECQIFNDREALVAHFRTIGGRGRLYNAEPAVAAGHDRMAGPDHVPSVLEGLVRGVQDLLSSRHPHCIYLIEAVPLGQAVAAGAGMVRRSHTSAPPGREPEGHVRVAGARGHAAAEAAGLFLDFAASISIAVAERMHHAVIIYQPPPGDTTPAFHMVLHRALGPDFRLQPWELMPAEAARAYLRP